MTASTLKNRSISRISYYALCALNYISALLLGDVFLVDVLQYAGFDDGAIGIVTSSAQFVSLVQILLIFVGHKIRRHKTVILFGFTNLGAMFALVYVVALIPAGTQLKQTLIVALLLIGRLTLNFASPVLNSFKYSFISYQERGVITATNNTIASAVGIVFTLVIGKVRDYYRESGNVEQGLIVTAILLGVLTVLTALSVVMMRGSSNPSESKPVTGVKDILHHTLGSKSFLCMLLFFIIWQIASTITTSFLGIYKINELGYSISTIQIINTSSSIVSMCLARPLGRLADKRSHSLCLKFSLMAYVVAFLVCALTAPETAWLAVVYTILSGISGLVLSSSFNNMLLEYIGYSYYMYGTALITCISGLFGFALSFAAAWLLELIQSMGNTLFGITVYAQQILAAISAVMVLGLLAFAHFVLTRLPKQQLAGAKEE